jgi:hypothetical protein
MITFLTRPMIPFKLREARYAAMGFIDKLRSRKARQMPRHGGHAAVNRSLFEGFRQLGVPLNIDPKQISQVHEVVFCTADPRSIWQGIRWKRAGRIKKLFAGFAIVGSPFDCKGVILNPAVDRYVCNSDWHLEWFAELAPEFRMKAVVSPLGVDPSMWMPSSNVRKLEKNVLFYKKLAPRDLYEECLLRVREAGFNVEEIVCGNYRLEDYALALKRNSLLVNWVAHETQGISMAEAWAADVPTMVWNPGSVFRESCGKTYVFGCSSSPYLTLATGGFFRDWQELSTLLDNYKAQRNKFTPRDWVLENLTDVICAKRLLKALDLARLID